MTIKAKRVQILGVQVDVVTMSEAVIKAEELIRAKSASIIATANAEMIMRATHDDELKQILNAAQLVVPDGAGTVWAARYLGYEMPERVAGYDLVQELLAKAAAKGYRVYMFGAAPTVADKAKLKAEALYPGVNIVGVRDGFFKPADEPAIIEEIKAARPDLLLVALGVPKQEKWMAANIAELALPLAIGVGGTFDVMAGVMKRAPKFMQRLKLEWLFRGMLQPTRAKRLLALPKFVIKVCLSKKT